MPAFFKPQMGPPVSKPCLTALASAMLCRFTASLEATNERMKAYATFHKHVKYVDCGHFFLRTQKVRV